MRGKLETLRPAKKTNNQFSKKREHIFLPTDFFSSKYYGLKIAEKNQNSLEINVYNNINNRTVRKGKKHRQTTRLDDR